ncbi:MAG: nicotinamide-nucleotide amidohydrolase family protein [Gammaproteobacteria bacterium]|nr:nicotinamide-nucleotide amidohydrolase family protein [Gammaproteobacteria bacterium]
MSGAGDAGTDLEALAARVGERLLARGSMLATAESCTGGLAASVVTAVPGSSRWFERGFVTYSNEAKCDMLGVGAETLAAHGAVSEAAVAEMARGALAHSRAGVSLAISGVAGPGGGSAAKPVGTVCLAWASRDGTAHARRVHCAGDRAAVRRQAVALALTGVLELLEQPAGEPGRAHDPGTR